MDIYKFFLSEKERLSTDIAKAEKQIGKNVDERIILNNKCGKTYLFIKEGDTKKKYIRKSEQKKYLPQIKRLYNEKKLVHDKMYLKAIENFLKNYNPKIQSAEDFLGENREIANLLCMQIQSVPKKAAEWFKADYESNPPFPEKRIIKTIHGEKVRSKSECLIADALLLENLPYRYEWPRKFCGITIHPDFVIMHPVTGEFYIWEHLGLTDDPEYLAKNMKKIELYAKAGFIAGKNLIITTESEEHPLDSDTVNMVIKRYFVR